MTGSKRARGAIHTICFVSLFVCSCTTTSTIRTSPPGAKVYLNNRYIGRTPVKVKLNDGFLDNAKYFVKIEKPGYETQQFPLEQTWRAGWIILDVLLLLPTLGISGYLIVVNGKRHKAKYHVVMEHRPYPTEAAERQPAPAPNDRRRPQPIPAERLGQQPAAPPPAASNSSAMTTTPPENPTEEPPRQRLH